MASDEAFRRFYSDDDDFDAGMYAYHYSDADHDDAGRDEEEPEASQQPAARRNPAARCKSARGPLRSVRRRLVFPPGCGGGAGPWGGKRWRKFLLWRLRWNDQRRQAREKARWSGVEAPPGLLDRIFLELEIDLGDD